MAGSPGPSGLPPASSATSLPFNQLIGGAVSPGLLNTNTTTTQPLNFATNSNNQQVSSANHLSRIKLIDINVLFSFSLQAYPVIGDYAMIANNLRNLT